MNLKSLLVTSTLMVITLATFASGDVPVNNDPNVKTFITNNKKIPDASYQLQLRSTGAWKNFADNHRNWTPIFSEENGKPIRAYGEPIAIGVAGNAQSKAYSFITNELSEFNIPVSELQYRNTATNQKYHYVNYKQFHNGLEVLWANIQVKMTLDGKVMLFGLKVYDNITISTAPALTTSAASAAASNLTGVTPTSVTVNPDLKILPIPQFHNNDYHLVYEVTVDGHDEFNFRSLYYTLVDANTGEILYRQDRVEHANIDVTITGTLYATHPYNPTTVEPLKYLRFNVNGSNYLTDTAGYTGLTNTPPVSATFYLQGSWASVNTNGTVPSFTQSLTTQASPVSFDTHANIKELSAYHSVQEIHDYYKNLAVSFPGIETTMDFPMTTNIDIAGSCNAYYDGTLNFFDADNVCNATSEVADVIYHEYGHGINDNVYAAYGGVFGNGSLGEGYADTWANGRTVDPILGIGFFVNNPTGYVRRYDINKKVYPQDLTGEVHANGEIIGGCWWDTGLNLGNMQDRQFLYLLTFAATLDEPAGNEGLLYQEVLIEALTDDDNDGNLANGTPHYCEITSAFGIHGITVSGASASIVHSEVLSAAGQSPIIVDATASNLPNAALPYGYYKLPGAVSWTQFPLNNVTGNNFEGTIPAQPNGTIVRYYLDLLDTCGTHLSIIPGRSNAANDPNLPFYILVGFDLLDSNAMEGAMTGWVAGAAGDNATTGQWTTTPEVPNPSYIGTTLVQTDMDHTPALGTKCYLTGNQVTVNGAGDWDLDGGHTTLTSATYDLSSVTNPAFTYWRWFSNNQGATPGTAPWQVSISNDGGTTWVDVEMTFTDDHGWRRYAFSVTPYVTPTANVKLRFIGSDGPAPSLVEAALDDIELWGETSVSVNEIQNIISFSVYPNPATEKINIRWNQPEQSAVSLQITDHLGQIVFRADPKIISTGIHSMNIPSENFANGIYFIKMQNENSNIVKKITVMN